ncbi:MAG: DUF6644 family protein [Acidobacteriota bacterium]
MVRSLSIWLHGTNLSWAARGGLPWLWPLCETLHFIGMAMLIGIVGLLDLRMLGLLKGLPLRPLQRLLPWGVAGFVINLLTGITFYSGDPFQYIDNNVFWLKMGFIALAGVNVLLFYATGLSDRVNQVGAGERVPGAARAVAAASLLLWLGVIYWGRMLPFLGGAF